MVEVVREQKENPQEKRRKRWSKVWDDFTMSTDGSRKAVCNHCQKEFDGSSKKGTTHLKNHSERCLRKRKNGGGDADGLVTKEKSVIDLIKRSFDAEGDPTEDWDPLFPNARKGDVLQVYKEEKEKLRKSLNNLSCRFSLTIDEGDDFDFVLAVSYIDDSWEMKTKIISYLPNTADDDEILIAHFEKVCSEWNIHTKICSIFGDSVGMLNGWVDKQASLPFGGLLYKEDDFLELHYIVETFLGRDHTTTTLNEYFPIFCDMHTKVLRGASDEITNQFFEDFWSRSNLILAIAVVLDPRFKMDIVEKWYKQIYGSEADVELESIRVSFTKVFNEYVKVGSNSGNATSSTSYKMLDAMGRPCKSSHQLVDDVDSSPKSELDRYLSEPTLPRVEEFSILTWWHAYTPIFPALARMARDFLPILICSYSELRSFCKKFDDSIFFDELDDDIKEALLCLLQWMYKPEK